MKKVLFVNYKKEQRQKMYSKFGREHNLKVKFINFDEITISTDGKVYVKNLEIKRYDLVFFGMIVSYSSQARYIINFCQTNNIPCMQAGNTKEFINKINVFKILTENKAKQIPTIITSDFDYVAKMIRTKEFKFPIITKPIDGSKGEGIKKHKTVNSLKNTVIKNYEKRKMPLIIQPFIQNDGDFRVLVLKNKIIGIIKRFTTKKGEFRSNISAGGQSKVADLPESVKKTVIKISKKFRADILGFDVIYDQLKKEYLFMEVNSAPQFGGFMQTTGINVDKLIVEEIAKLLSARVN